MTSIKAHREKSLADTKTILESGLTTLDALSVTLSTLPYQTGGDSLSKAEAAFVAALSGNDGADVEKANDVVDAAYKAARDALCLGCEHVRIFERFIGLHCPKMGELKHCSPPLVTCFFLHGVPKSNDINTFDELFLSAFSISTT